MSPQLNKMIHLAQKKVITSLLFDKKKSKTNLPSTKNIFLFRQFVLSIFSMERKANILLYKHDQI